eukprot:jgi/Bigna1/134856/aug1.27_g9564
MTRLLGIFSMEVMEEVEKYGMVVPYGDDVDNKEDDGETGAEGRALTLEEENEILRQRVAECKEKILALEEKVESLKEDAKKRKEKVESPKEYQVAAFEIAYDCYVERRAPAHGYTPNVVGQVYGHIDDTDDKSNNSRSKEVPKSRKFMYSSKDIKVVRLLGKGNFAHTYEAVFSDQKKQVALKIPKSKISGEEYKAEMMGLMSVAG